MYFDLSLSFLDFYLNKRKLETNNRHCTIFLHGKTTFKTKLEIYQIVKVSGILRILLLKQLMRLKEK